VIDCMKVPVTQRDSEVLQSLLEVGLSLSTMPGRRDMLDVILREARKLARAEAGSLYVQRNNRLRFAAAQNDRLAMPRIIQNLLDKEMSVSMDSLAGFAASTGQVLNIPDAYSLPSGGPFQHNRKFDEATGYRTRSILALPLKQRDGYCVGVLELLNHVGLNGKIVSFPDVESNGLLSLASMAAVTIHNALLTEDLKQAHLDTIIRLSIAAEFRDGDTADHIKRMSRTAALIARGMGMGEDLVELIEYASPMHDIGKIGIPDTILQKSGPLTPQERNIVEKHPVIGAEIFKDSNNELTEMAHDVALSHHERWDGTGYPNKLSGENIRISARIVALADVFDALVTKRCYKDPHHPNEALDIIRHESGKHFDPDVTEAFFDVLDDVLLFYQLTDVETANVATAE